MKAVVLAVGLLFAASGSARAQVAASAAPDEFSRPWFTIGGGSTTLLGDCTGCAGDQYVHSGSVRANGGVSLNRRLDAGGEYMWAPQTLSTGDRIQVSFVLATVQFRPWVSRGFFLDAGSGMAFLKNWLDIFAPQQPPIRSKAFALEIGAGWEWRTPSHFGIEVYGSQHVGALGDLQTSVRTAENVVGNLWSVGAALVIR